MTFGYPQTCTEISYSATDLQFASENSPFSGLFSPGRQSGLKKSFRAAAEVFLRTTTLDFGRAEPIPGTDRPPSIYNCKFGFSPF